LRLDQFAFVLIFDERQLRPGGRGMGSETTQ